MVLISEVQFFLKKGLRSVFPSMRLTPNIRKNFSYLFGISALEDNTEHINSFFKIFRSPTALGSAQALWQKPPGGVHSSVVQTRPDAAEASVV